MAQDLLTINDPPGRDSPISWYEASAPRPDGLRTCALPQGPRAAEQRAEICVIGGGYSGLSAALHLARQGRDVRLFEARHIGFGASGRNGGQVSTGQRLDQPQLEARFGMARAQALWQAGLDAVALTRRLAEESGLDCQWRPGILHAMHRPRFVRAARDHARHLREAYGYEQIQFLDRAAIHAALGSADYHAGTLDMGGAHLHPLRYAQGLALLAQRAGAQIHEGARVLSLEGLGSAPRLVVEQAGQRVTLVPDHLILAMNGYHNGLVAPLARKVMAINNFIAATQPLGRARASDLIRHGHAVADSRFVINYFRLTPDDRLLFGGGESYGDRFPRDIAAKVRGPMLRVFPQLEGVGFDYAWGGTLGITLSRLPHLARLGPRCLSLSGYSGQGVALATLAGQLAAAALVGGGGAADRLAAAAHPGPENQPGPGVTGFSLFEGLAARDFPGGARLRLPLLALAMGWFSLRDRL